MRHLIVAVFSMMAPLASDAAEPGVCANLSGTYTCTFGNQTKSSTVRQTSALSGMSYSIDGRVYVADGEMRDLPMKRDEKWGINVSPKEKTSCVDSETLKFLYIVRFDYDNGNVVIFKTESTWRKVSPNEIRLFIELSAEGHDRSYDKEKMEISCVLQP